MICGLGTTRIILKVHIEDVTHICMWLVSTQKLMDSWQDINLDTASSWTSSKHDQFSPKYSQKTLHSSPERANYEVSFVSSKSNFICACHVMLYWKSYHDMPRYIKCFYCTHVTQLTVIIEDWYSWQMWFCINFCLIVNNIDRVSVWYFVITFFCLCCIQDVTYSTCNFAWYLHGLHSSTILMVMIYDVCLNSHYFISLIYMSCLSSCKKLLYD